MYLIVEYFEATARGYFTDGGGVESVVEVTVPALYEYRRVGQALGVHLAVHVVEVHPLADVPPGVLDGRVAVHVGELAEAEPVVVLVAGVGEAVDDDAVAGGVVDLAHPAVELVVGDGGPVERLLEGHGLALPVVGVHAAALGPAVGVHPPGGVGGGRSLRAALGGSCLMRRLCVRWK